VVDYYKNIRRRIVMNFKKLFSYIDLWLKTRDKEQRQLIIDNITKELKQFYSDNYKIESIEILRNENGIKVILSTYSNKEILSTIKFHPAINKYKITIDGYTFSIEKEI
jgi:hypothetical protein